MELPLSEVAVFEDALYCVKTTKAAGFYTYAVMDESAARDAKEIRACCDRYLESFDELVEELTQ